MECFEYIGFKITVERGSETGGKCRIKGVERNEGV